MLAITLPQQVRNQRQLQRQRLQAHHSDNRRQLRPIRLQVSRAILPTMHRVQADSLLAKSRQRAPRQRKRRLHNHRQRICSVSAQSQQDKHPLHSHPARTYLILVPNQQTRNQALPSQVLAHKQHPPPRYSRSLQSLSRLRHRNQLLVGLGLVPSRQRLHRLPHRRSQAQAYSASQTSKQRPYRLPRRTSQVQAYSSSNLRLPRVQSTAHQSLRQQQLLVVSASLQSLLQVSNHQRNLHPSQHQMASTFHKSLQKHKRLQLNQQLRQRPMHSASARQHQHPRTSSRKAHKSPHRTEQLLQHHRSQHNRKLTYSLLLPTHFQPRVPRPPSLPTTRRKLAN